MEGLGKEESLAIAAEEYRRIVALLRALDSTDWERQVQDCPAWNVRQLVAHLIANAESIASPLEAGRQQIKTLRRAKRTAEAFIDALGAVGVEAREHLSPIELTLRLERAGGRSLTLRRRLPAAIRNLKLNIPEPIGAKVPLSYMLDTIYVRDTWMHRVDLTRATGRELELTPEHDGRFVADVVAEWAHRHGEACTLTLEGPAGGTFDLKGGDHANSYRLDAVEFCRVVSGRGTAEGLLATPVPF